MSTRRIALITTIPPYVKRVFFDALDPATSEERLWRERAARMTLDALGYTNLTMKKKRHNAAVRYARRWFRGVYSDLDNRKLVDNPSATFDAAGVDGFEKVRSVVLAVTPCLFEEKEAAK